MSITDSGTIRVAVYGTPCFGRYDQIKDSIKIALSDITIRRKTQHRMITVVTGITDEVTLVVNKYAIRNNYQTAQVYPDNNLENESQSINSVEFDNINILLGTNPKYFIIYSSEENKYTDYIIRKSKPMNMHVIIVELK